VSSCQCTCSSKFDDSLYADLVISYNAASACGNIIGPLLFTDDDAPLYKSGLKACMGLFAALIGCVMYEIHFAFLITILTPFFCRLQVLNLMLLNKAKSRQRVKNGKPADIRDLSMEKKYSASAKHVADDKMETSTTGVHLGDQGLLDMTDRENDEVGCFIIWCLFDCADWVSFE